MSVTLGPRAQLSHLFYNFCSMLGSITQSTDSVFKRVHLEKKDDEGNIKSYPEIGSVLTYIEDTRTGKLYLDEEGYVISCKCVMIVLGLSLYAPIMITGQAVKMSYCVFAKAISTIQNVCSQIWRSEWLEAVKQLGQGALEIGKTLGRKIYEIIKVPFFTLACGFAAIYGIFKPHFARVYEAEFEYAWQQGMTYKQDYRKPPENAGCFTDLQENEGSACFLAYCFQPRGNIADKGISILKTEEL